ncbi:MAG TPA: hypothetical protein VMM76_13250, partial [Pirellulaceae bacterium]|nr:hypothetical protein [Pirellulaceae bacterium]
LKALREELRLAYAKRVDLESKEAQHAILEELRSPLNNIKALKKYAEGEVQRVFTDIRDKTISNWRTLYPETSSGLAPARVVVGTGRDKSVTTFLSKSAYEVPGQFFGNAGLQRAVALSFYFALLEKHPRGLAFVIMDDPILSLDDGHRESWSREILKPWMQRCQFIIATHQAHYLTNCRSHFSDGQVVELNPRKRQSRMSWRPGNRLDRAAQELERAPTNAPTEMRKYREELLYTLDAYSTTPFFDRHNLAQSLQDYESFAGNHPLASKAQTKVIETLRDARVTTVLDPGSHALTEADVTAEMSEDCLRVLRDRERTVRSEFDRLEWLRLHSQRQAAIPSSLVPFVNLPIQANWSEPIELVELGRAAAKEESWEVDLQNEPGTTVMGVGSAVLVAADTLDPVAKRGQWLLLAINDGAFHDGDLVAVTCANGAQLARRIWSNGDTWVLQSINPVKPIADVVVPKTESAPRKIIGVLYEPCRPVASSGAAAILEWQPRADFQVKWIKNLASVYVEGSSLEPIARAGQRVLIDNDSATDQRHFRNSDLAVVDTKVDGIGCVVKRAYHHGEDCILTSPNPVDPHPPEILSKSQLLDAVFWIVRGVQFESNS